MIQYHGTENCTVSAETFDPQNRHEDVVRLWIKQPLTASTGMACQAVQECAAKQPIPACCDRKLPLFQRRATLQEFLQSF